MKKSKGLTLIELLMALLILSIIIAIGIPSFQHLLDSNRSRSLTNQLYTLLQYTRSKAVFSSGDVILCPSKNREKCTNDWSSPLIVFIDNNKNEKRDDDETIDREVQLTSKGENIYWRSFGRKPFIRFINDGSTVFQSGNFTICPKNRALKYIKKIVIFRSGRPRLAQPEEIKVDHCDP